MRHEHFPRPHEAIATRNATAPRAMVGIVKGAIGSVILWALIVGVIFVAH